MQKARSHIIATAIELIEADGVEAVSMYRLASELGCSLICLYSYVPSRSALLDGVGNQVMSAVSAIPVPNECWQERLRAQARAFRTVARQHPRSAVLAMSGPSALARMARPMQTALAALRDAGFADRDAVGIARTVLAYTVGSIVREAAVEAGVDAGIEAGVAPGHADGEDFEFGLTLLLQAVAARAPVSRSYEPSRTDQAACRTEFPAGARAAAL